MSYRGFPTPLIATVVCQHCLTTLPTGSHEPFITDGVVTCQNCGMTYNIRGGILDLLEKQKIDKIREGEIVARDREAAKYDGRLAVRHEKEVVTTLDAIGDVSGRAVIEYGAGTGRLTMEYAAKAKMVLACDFSLASLNVLARKEFEGTIGLVHADATTLRTAPHCFDLALATQFYEHIPTKKLRDDFLAHCRETLKPRGVFVSTTYHYDLRMRLKQVPQEGMHRTGIFYHYYTLDELRRDIGQYFTITESRPIDITLPLEARLGVPATLGGILSRIFEHVPLVRELGHLALVVAQKIA